MRATVICDASFCHETKAGGWACWIAYDDKAKGRHSGKFRSRPKDSGIAELQAVLNGIWISYQNGARDILIQTDCTSVVHAIKGVGAYARTYLQAKAEHFPQAVIRSKHVRGHTSVDDARSWCQRWCDAEAKKHMRDQRKQPSGSPSESPDFQASGEDRGRNRRRDRVRWRKPLSVVAPRAPSSDR